MQEFLNHPITQGIVITFLSTLIIGLMTGFLRWLKSQFTQLIRRLEMVHIEIKATDYAIEKSMGNGYTGYRRDKISELIGKSKYVNQDDFKD